MFCKKHNYSYSRGSNCPQCIADKFPQRTVLINAGVIRQRKYGQPLSKEAESKEAAREQA